LFAAAASAVRRHGHVHLLCRNDHKEASPATDRPMNTIKSKQRVTDHGEVFTSAWMVEAMLNLVNGIRLLVRLKVFNTEQMNQAVFAFRRYEDASLRYPV
jgi:hypothetical protein